MNQRRSVVLLYSVLIRDEEESASPGWMFLTPTRVPFGSWTLFSRAARCRVAMALSTCPVATWNLADSGSH